MKLKILLPLSLTTILIIVFGNVLKIDSWTYTKLILSAVTFELVCFLLSKPKQNDDFSFKASVEKFSTFIRQTKYFLILYFIILIYDIWKGSSALYLLFYIQIIIVFYSIGFILSMNNIKMKE